MNEWEAAWAAYIEAEEAYHEARQHTSRRSVSGYRRGYRGACIRRRKAIEKLRQLDSEFCDRLGIK